ncbi:hypothetical protein HD806DRAFT_488829 [Xylariaceae sp. AK1471]|nr:hypothetical protein HD806DRAFT_488829 [Xylariaceae sp. AK1471]
MPAPRGQRPGRGLPPQNPGRTPRPAREQVLPRLEDQPEGYKAGFQEGYESGYEKGKHAGYGEGQNAGYAAGYTAGIQGHPYSLASSPTSHQPGQSGQQQQQPGQVKSGFGTTWLPMDHDPNDSNLNRHLDPSVRVAGGNGGTGSGNTQQYRENFERSKTFEDDDEWIPNIKK